MPKIKKCGPAISLAGLIAIALLAIGAEGSKQNPQQYGKPDQYAQAERAGSGSEWSALEILTGILAVATLGLVGIAILQIRDSRILQRAYVAAEPAGIFPRDSDQMIHGVAEFRNAGNLPARDVSWVLNIEFDGNPDRRLFQSTRPLRGKHVISPRSFMARGTIPIKVPPDCPEFCYVWGTITYTDGFGRGRFTDFCHRYNCFTASFHKHQTIDRRDGRQHDHHNDAN